MSKLLHWHEQEKNFLNTLADWQTYVIFSEPLQDFFAFIIPWAPFLLIVSTLFEFLGGLLILLGIREKLGAFLLILVLIPATILMHQFWFIEGPQRELQVVHFLKNLAILGGLLIVWVNGATQSGKPAGFSPMKFG